MAMNKFQTKAKLLEVLGRVYEDIEIKKNNRLEDYRELEELEQKKEYNRETRDYDLVWEDEEQTIPKMVNKWGYVTVTPEELDDEAKAEYDAYVKILVALEKLM